MWAFLGGSFVDLVAGWYVGLVGLCGNLVLLVCGCIWLAWYLACLGLWWCVFIRWFGLVLIVDGYV